jgi:diguanylate cyclase (GGDEF)-like protein
MSQFQLKKSLTNLEMWSFGVSGQIGWAFSIPFIHTILGLSAMLVWVPISFISMLINFQIAEIATKYSHVVGGTPNLISQLWLDKKHIAKYAAYGYYWAWLSAIIIYSFYFAEFFVFIFSEAQIQINITVVQISFIIIGYLISLSSQRLLPIVNFFLVTPIIITILLICLIGGYQLFQDLSWIESLTKILDISFVQWSQWFFLVTYSAYSAEVVSVFVAESIHPKKSINLIRLMAWTMPIIFIFGSFVVAVLGPKVIFTTNYEFFIQVFAPIFGEFSKFISSFLIIFITSLSGVAAISILPRILFQLGKDGLAHINFTQITKRSTLDVAIWTSFVFTILAAFLIRVNDIVVIATVGYFATFILLHFGIFHKRKDFKNSFPRLSLVIGLCEVAILFIGGFTYNSTLFMFGLAVPLLSFVVDIVGYCLGFIIRLFDNTYTKIPKIRTDFILTQLIYILLIIFLILLFDYQITHIFVAGEPVKTLIFSNINLLLMTLFCVAILAIVLAGWLTIPQMIEIEEAREKVEETNMLLKDDINKRKIAEKALVYNVNHDTLTGIGSRDLLYKRLNSILKSQVTKKESYHICFLDLNKFKWINDTLGHTAGDFVLKEIAQRLKNTFSDGNVFRFGGDEFVIILHEITNPKQISDFSKKLQYVIEERIEYEQKDIYTSSSMGITKIIDKHKNPDDVLKECDIAMYHAKHNQKSYEIFSSNIGLDFIRQHEIYTALKSAILGNQISVAYQPIIELKSGRCIGFEALARWFHPTLGQISPATFIKIAEDTHLIDGLSEQVISKALKLISSLNKTHKSLSMNINLSAKQLNHHTFEFIMSECIKLDISPSMIHIELTESAILEDIDSVQKIIQTMHAKGFLFYLDDFGTGYSNLSYLKSLSLQALKIDKSFIDNYDESKLYYAIQTIANSLELSTVAEGVETQSQVDFISKLGVQFAQGYYYSKPLTSDEATTFLLK